MRSRHAFKLFEIPGLVLVLLESMCAGVFFHNPLHWKGSEQDSHSRRDCEKRDKPQSCCQCKGKKDKQGQSNRDGQIPEGEHKSVPQQAAKTGLEPGKQREQPAQEAYWQQKQERYGNIAPHQRLIPTQGHRLHHSMFPIEKKAYWKAEQRH